MASNRPTPDVVCTGDKLVEFDKASQTVYVTTAHDVVLGQGLSGDNYVECPSDADLVLFADCVTIVGRCEAPGRTITIFTRLIVAEPAEEDPAIIVDGTKGKEPAIKVKASKPEKAAKGWPGQRGAHGKKGDDGAQKTDAGDDGANGGKIRIFCHRARAPFNLDLSARGGAGGNGPDGQSGGNGGDGGDGYSTENGTRYDATDGGDAGAPGKPGPRGDGGKGGRGGEITFHAASKDAADGLPSIKIEFESAEYRIIKAVAAGDDGLPGEDGKWGDPGNPGAAGVGQQYFLPNSGYNRTKDGHPGARWTGQRDPLRPPMEAWLAPAQYRQLVAGCLPNALWAPVERTYPNAVMVAAREFSRTAPKYLRNPKSINTLLGFMCPQVGNKMKTKQGSIDVKRGAGLDFYLKSKDFKPDFSWLTSYLRMQRNRARFLFIEGGTGTLKDDNPTNPDEKARLLCIKEAKNRIDWVNAIIDARTANDDKEANALGPLAASLGEIEDSMQQGRNAFGKEHSWAPNVRFEVYRKRLQSAIEHLNDAETKVKECRTQLLQLQHNDAQRAALAEAAESSIEEYKKEYDQAKNIIFEAKSEIERGEAPILAARETLKNAFQKLSAEARGKANWGELVFEKLLDVVFQVGFMPEEPLKSGMHLAKSASLLGVTATKSALGSWKPTITGDNGQPIQLNYVLDQVSAMAASVEDLALGFRQLRNGDLLKTDTKMLLTTKATLKKLLDKFYNTSVEIHNCEAAMNALVDAVDARNGAILKMNAALAAYAQAEVQMNSCTKLVNSARVKRAANNLIGLPELVDLIDGYQNEARERCLRSLYCLSRAYYLWELPDEYTFFDEFKISGAWDFDSTVAKRISQKEIDKWEKTIDAGWSETGIPTPVKKTENLKQNGITIVIEDQTFTVVLAAVGEQKNKVIEEVRAATSLGLKEATDLVGGAPKPVKQGIGKDEAEKIKAALEKLGAKIELKKLNTGALVKPEVFASLRKNRAAEVTIPPSKRDAPIAPFNDMYHVRLRVARCWLMGATSKNGLVRLELTQSGTETFVTPDNRSVEVTHDPLPIHFWYWADKEGKLEALATRPAGGHASAQPKDGNLNDSQHSEIYAAVGPFAKWTIKVLDDENVVELSKVDAIVFEFFVYYRPPAFH